MNQQGTFSQSNILEVLGSVAATDTPHQILFNCFNKTFAFLFKESKISIFLSSEIISLENYLVGLEIITLEQMKELSKYKSESGVEMSELVLQAEVVEEKRLNEVYTELTEDTLAFLFTVPEGQYIIEEGSGETEVSKGSLPFSKLADLETKVNKCVESLKKLEGYDATYYLNDSGDIKSISSDIRIAKIIDSLKVGNSIIKLCQDSYVGYCDSLEILTFLYDEKHIQRTKPVENIQDSKIDSNEKEKKSNTESNNNEPVQLNTDTPLPSIGNFSGSLEILSLVEIIQTLFSAKRTGVLMLDIKDGPGIIHIQKGEVVHVEYKGVENKDAFYELIKIKLGEFYFEGGEKDVKKTMEIPTMSLLMEAMRQMDEGAGGASFNIDNAFSDEEPPKSVRRLKTKSSKLVMMLKLLIVLGLAGGAAYALLVYKPHKEKVAAFAPVIEEVNRQISQKKFDKAISAWKGFLKLNKIDHPDWEDDILQSLAEVVSKRDDEIDAVFFKVDTFLKNKSFYDAQNLLHANKFLATDDNHLTKKFEEKLTAVTQKQKELNYFQWKTESSKKIEKALELTNEYKNREALEILGPIKEFLDIEKEPEITKSFNKVMSILSDRESKIKSGYEVIDSNQSTIDQKINANTLILENAGKDSDRGKIAIASIEKLKGQLELFKIKVQEAISKLGDKSTDELVKLLDKLEGEASSFEEISFIQKEKSKVKDIESSSLKIFNQYKKARSEKDIALEFDLAKKMFEEFATASSIENVTLPVKLIGLPDDELLIDGKENTPPADLRLHINDIVEVLAKRKGCEDVKLTLKKDLVKSHNVFLNFIKKSDWSIDVPGDINVWPKTNATGESFFIANGFDLELYSLKNGQKIWQRQINNPNKPYIKLNGTKVMIGDDDFWKLKSQIEVNDEFVGINSKNAEMNIFRIRDGNPMLKHELESEGVGKPLLVRMALLGNRNFVFCCTSKGQILNIAIDDKLVRYEELIGNNENQIVGLETINEHFYAVIFDRVVKCYSLSNSKVKWEKPFLFRTESYLKSNGKIYVLQKNALIELGPELSDFKNINIPEQMSYQNATGSHIVCVDKNGKVYRLENSSEGFIELKIPFKVTSATCLGDQILFICEGKINLFDNKKQALIWRSEDKFQFENLAIVGDKVLGKTKTSYVAFSILP